MEYLHEGDLTKHISTPLPEDSVQNISKQILEGLKVMHQQGIAHQHLKPEVIAGDFQHSSYSIILGFHYDTYTSHSQKLGGDGHENNGADHRGYAGSGSH